MSGKHDIQGTQRDIYNIDETGLFYHDAINKTFSMRGADCGGRKQSKDRSMKLWWSKPKRQKETIPTLDKIDNFIARIKLFTHHNGRNDMLKPTMELHDRSTTI